MDGDRQQQAERVGQDVALTAENLLAGVARTRPWRLAIVSRCDRRPFVVLPKRWIVERTPAWISCCRRQAAITSATPAGPPPSSVSP
jgi:transposase